MRNVIRTICFGNLASDCSAALETGLWPIAFIGYDGMSDKQAALLCLGIVIFFWRSKVEYHWLGQAIKTHILKGYLLRPYTMYPYS